MVGGQLVALNWLVRGRDTPFVALVRRVRGWQDCWFWKMDPMSLQRKRAPVLRLARNVFPENGTDPSRFRNCIPRRRRLIAMRKGCGMRVANGGVMEKLRPLHCLAFVLITLFLASCASQTQPATTSTTTSGTTQSQSPLDRNGGNGLASFIH